MTTNTHNEKALELAVQLVVGISPRVDMLHSGEMRKLVRSVFVEFKELLAGEDEADSESDSTKPTVLVGRPDDLPQMKQVIDDDPMAEKRRIAREKAVNMCNQMLANDILIIDFETSGWGDGFEAEIIQIAAINGKGEVLLDQLISPKRIIQHKATRHHGITPEMTMGKPQFEEVWINQLLPLLDAHTWIVAYNSDFEQGKLDEEVKRMGGNLADYMLQWWDPMPVYAGFNGEWKEEKQDWKWKKLTEACERLGVEVDEQAHSSLGDVKRTLGIIQKMAEQKLS